MLNRGVPVQRSGQSVSNASNMKVAQKPRGTARFRRYELVSVCGISAMEAPFLPPVSAGLFLCLAFAVCPGDVPNMLNTVERHIAWFIDESQRATCPSLSIAQMMRVGLYRPEARRRVDVLLGIAPPEMRGWVLVHNYIRHET